MRFVGMALAASIAAPGAPARGELQKLRDAVAEVVAAAPGEMGVAIEHLESGKSVEVNGEVSFPMASTFKLALLSTLFQQVDQGKIQLDEMVSLEKGDVHLGSGDLRDFLVPGVTLSIENLALIMMRISDNSATDKLLALVGMESVNRRLADLGIAGMSVHRTCQRLILDSMGMEEEKTAGMSYREILDFLNAYQPAPGELEAAASEFEKDPRDSATPLAMNRLLRAIFQGQDASEASRARMYEILLGCETGRNRLRGRLPDGVELAHKTGTLGGAVNDVGLLTLPEGGGHVAISVLSRGMTDRDEAERAIADVARYAYDYFVFFMVH